jgi:hypothetical protein
LVRYLLLEISQVLVINPVITKKYSLQEEIPETIIIIITINHHHKSIQSYSNQRGSQGCSSPWAWLIYQFLTLCRGCTLYPRVVIPFQPGLYRPDLHYRGEWPGIHYVAFTKNIRGHSRPLGFSSLINTVLLPAGRVTNKTKSKGPRQWTSIEQVLCPDPIDNTTAKPTTPQVPLINQLRVSHSTLMVVPWSRVVSQRTGSYREVLRKQPESPKVSQIHHHNQDNIIIS